MNKVNAPMHGRRAAAIQHQLQLPHDIHVEILSWLPAKSLLRFRAVCHAWDAACGDTDFALLHVDRQAGRQPRCRLRVECASSHHLATRLSLSLVDRGCRVESEIGPMNLEGYHKVVGSCNGLLCLLILWKGIDALYVCNPLLGQVLLLSLPQLFEPHRYVDASYGFGFTRATHEFKVVRLVTTGNLNRANQRTFLDVYTLPLRTGGRWAWRAPTKQLPYHQCPYLRYPTFHAFLNGKLHWLAREEEDVAYRTYVVVSWDLAEERIEVLPCVKDARIQHRLASIGIAEIDGCLSTIFNFPQESRLEVWMMREYGKVESWTKILSFKTTNLFHQYSLLMIPRLAFISDCEILMTNDIGNSIAYNTTTERISERFPLETQLFLDHIPSLILVMPRERTLSN